MVSAFSLSTFSRQVLGSPVPLQIISWIPVLLITSCCSPPPLPLHRFLVLSGPPLTGWRLTVAHLVQLENSSTTRPTEDNTC